jgi:hypothetical protein
MSTADRPTLVGVPGFFAGLAAVALLVGACGSTPTPTQLPAGPTAAATPEATTPAPTPSPSPTASPSPTPTIAPTESPSASPSASPTASPSPAAPTTTTVDDYAWVYDKHPMRLSGTAGTTTWTKLLFAANTVALKWSATPASAAGCTFTYKLTSKTLPKAAAGTQKIKGAKPASGSRNLTIKYGDGVMTVTTDCSKYSVTATSTGHPGITITQADAPYRITGTTADELNKGLAKAYADWGIRYYYKYYASPARVASFTVTVPIRYKLPIWTPPVGADQSLVDAYNAALKNMRIHTEGEAAIAIQAAGRYHDAANRTRFTSVSAMQKYFDDQANKSIDAASNRNSTYNDDTNFGDDQGAFID